MMETEGTNGIATIEVFHGNRVIITRRVKTIFGGVAWRVINRSTADVTVCVRNFRPATALEPKVLDRHLLLQTGECTRGLSPRQSGWIVAEFQGRPGDLFNYDVFVNETLAGDPELEI